MEVPRSGSVVAVRSVCGKCSSAGPGPHHHPVLGWHGGHWQSALEPLCQPGTGSQAATSSQCLAGSLPKAGLLTPLPALFLLSPPLHRICVNQRRPSWPSWVSLCRKDTGCSRGGRVAAGGAGAAQSGASAGPRPLCLPALRCGEPQGAGPGSRYHLVLCCAVPRCSVPRLPQVALPACPTVTPLPGCPQSVPVPPILSLTAPRPVGANFGTGSLASAPRGARLSPWVDTVA